MSELTPWPYEKLPSYMERIRGTKRYVLQYTEDGFYGFAFRGKDEVAGMIGPYESDTACFTKLLIAAHPNA